MISLQGHLLISAPELSDLFAQSVILMVRHNEEGAFGLILNRACETRVNEVWHKLSSLPCDTNELLNVGGPVEGPLMALHSQADLQEFEVLPGLFFTANRDLLELLVLRTEEPAKYFVGYSGWSAGQLEAELKRGSWQVLPAKTAHVFASDERLWELVRRELADYRLRAELHIKHSPPDVRMN